MEKWAKVMIGDTVTTYEVSTMGNVRNGSRLLRPFKDATTGYLKVDIRCGRRYARTVHSLVANAFLTRPDHYRAEVRHLNNDKSDNRVENLSWGSSRDNKLDGPTVRIGHNQICKQCGGTERNTEGNCRACRNSYRRAVYRWKQDGRPSGGPAVDYIRPNRSRLR